MAKVFVLLERGNRITGYEETRIELLGTSNEEVARLRTAGWRFQWPPFLVEQDGGGGTTDLTEVYDRLGGLEEAIDMIGNTHNQIWKAIDELKQDGNGHIPTYSFEFDVWCMRPEDGNVAGSGAILSKYGFVDGDTLTARFSIKVGGSVSDGIFYIVPQAEVQPTGYASFFLGTATKHSKKEGWMLDGVAYWHRRNEFGSGKQGIRLQFPTFNPVMGHPHYQDHEYYRPGGALYAGKTGIGGDPWSPDGEDTYEVTIQLP